MSLIRYLAIAAVLCILMRVSAVAQSFSWDNAIVYFVMTDRFVNGDETNDHAYGRALDSDGNVVPLGEYEVEVFPHGVTILSFDWYPGI